MDWGIFEDGLTLSATKPAYSPVGDNALVASKKAEDSALSQASELLASASRKEKNSRLSTVEATTTAEATTTVGDTASSDSTLSMQASPTTSG